MPASTSTDFSTTRRRTAAEMALAEADAYTRRLDQAVAAADRHRAKLDLRLARAHADRHREAKRADDRVKVLLGAYVADSLRKGRVVQADTPESLLAALDAWLVRRGEREAVLGVDGAGSAAWRRVVAGVRGE